MDRTGTNLRKCLAYLLAVAAIGPGCSRLQKYRAQNSPLPLPRLGLLGRGTTGEAGESARPAVSWSGEPNRAAPVAALAEPKAPPPGEKIPSEAATAAPTTDVVSTEVLPLVKSGRNEFARMTSYQVAIHRQERAGGTLQPAEDVLLSFRNRPKGVRLEWPDGPHKGREVIYSPAETAGMMRIHMPDSLIPVPDLSLAPDSPMVMKYSRHPITEAGLDAVLERLEVAILQRVPGNGSVVDGGVVTPPEVGKPCRKVIRRTPRDEIWTVFLDVQSGIPVMILETMANGDLLEHNVFRDLTVDPPALADASAFDPARRWNSGRGFFSRMAGGATEAPVPDAARR